MTYCDFCGRRNCKGHRCSGMTRYVGDSYRGGHRERIDDPVPVCLKPEVASKDLAGKIRYDLIPPLGLKEVAIVYGLGAGKYTDWNWRKGMPWLNVYGALMRHVLAWRAGESRCPKDGQHHLASAVFWAFALMEYETYGLGEDNRPEGK